MPQERLDRPVHNTNSPNFVKLDFEDMGNIRDMFMYVIESGAILSNSQRVTYLRIQAVQKNMAEKRALNGKT